MLYNPRMTNIVLFIKYINQIVDLYSISAVLKQLPLYIYEKAMKWYTSLEEEITE